MVVTGKAEAGAGYDPLVAFLDMPFSLVADVLFIPHDFQTVRERSKSQRFPINEAEQDTPSNSQ